MCLYILIHKKYGKYYFYILKIISMMMHYHVMLICSLLFTTEVALNTYYLITSNSDCIYTAIAYDTMYSNFTISIYFYTLICLSTLYLLCTLIFLRCKRSEFYSIGFGISMLSFIATCIWCYMFYCVGINSCDQSIKIYLISVVVTNIVVIPIIYIICRCYLSAVIYDFF